VKVHLESLGRISLLLPAGRLDFGSSAGFQRELEAALAGGGTAPAGLIVDCAALEYVSSAGLRVLLQAARAAQRAGIWFALCGLQPAAREVFGGVTMTVEDDGPIFDPLSLPPPDMRRGRASLQGTGSGPRMLRLTAA
jgi:anti-sigma B factor antagonist